MNGPRIQNDERGITVNKSLAWAMVMGLIGGGLLVGREAGAINGAITDLTEMQAQRHTETLQVRRDIDARLRILENSRATDSSEITALRRDLTTFRGDMQELKDLLRSVESGLAR